MAKQKGSILTKVDYDEIRRVVKEEVKELISETATKDQVAHLPTKDEFYEKMDQVLGEVKAMREDFAAHKSSHERIDEDASKLKKQVKHLFKTFEIVNPTEAVPSY